MELACKYFQAKSMHACMVNLTTSSEELRTQTLHELGIMGHFKITVRGISKEKKKLWYYLWLQENLTLKLMGLLVNKPLRTNWVLPSSPLSWASASQSNKNSGFLTAASQLSSPIHWWLQATCGPLHQAAARSLDRGLCLCIFCSLESHFFTQLML